MKSRILLGGVFYPNSKVDAANVDGSVTMQLLRYLC